MPQRFLRPGVTTSQRWNTVPYDAQTLFIRLLTLVDDFGRYDADFRLLRSHAFPYGDPQGREIKLQTIENMCLQLSTVNLVTFYRSDGKQYLQLERWNEKARAAESKYPAYSEVCEQMFANVSKCSPPSPSPSPSPSPLTLVMAPAFKRQAANAAEGLPEGLRSERFEKTWSDWEQHRKEIKKPLTPTQRKAQLAHFAKLGEEKAIAAIEHTIFKGWQGIKEPEQNNGTHKHSNTESRRNVGTANEGRSSQYAGVGKVPGV